MCVCFAISGKINWDDSLSGSLSYLRCSQNSLKAKNMQYFWSLDCQKKKKKHLFFIIYSFLWVFILTSCRKKCIYLYDKKVLRMEFSRSSAFKWSRMYSMYRVCMSSAKSFLQKAKELEETFWDLPILFSSWLLCKINKQINKRAKANSTCIWLV